ncbi:hypothetical protein GNQ27_25165 [Pseudomonas aeruginosa]|nr:hypothetical protein [Pseudomonas aeruginosa]
MSMEMNKALDLLREIRPSIPKEVLELWCKDRDAFLASHPAVEQAGGDERVIGWRERILAAHPNSDPGFWPDALLVEHMAAEIADLRAALGQPSPPPHPAPELDFSRPLETENGDPVKWICADVIEYKSARVCVAKDTGLVYSSPYIGLKIRNVMPEHAEAERPEVVGYRSKESGMVYEQDYGLKNPEALTTVAECERIVGALRAENAKLSEALDECDGDRWKLRSERDAANARLHEVATACATAEQQREAALARVAELKTMADNYCALLMDANAKLAELEKQDLVVVPGPDEIHQMAFEEGQPAEDGDGYLFSAEEFDLFVQRLLDSCAAPVDQAQHSVPVAREQLERLVRILDAHNYAKDAEALMALLAAAPGKEGV